MRASRRFAFRNHEQTDNIATWFVQEDDPVDYLFLDLNMQPKIAASIQKLWTASSRHHCRSDVYDAAYAWHNVDIAMESSKVTYEVKGPQKGYVSTTLFTRT